MTRGSAEVIVVGAGPAGAAAALLLARAGRDVLLVDRAAFPRPKPCGDCLSIGASALLDRLGVLHVIAAGPHARLRGWQIVAPNGCAFEASFDDCAIAAERSVLDAVLVDAALAAGARFEQFTATDVERDARGHVCGVRSRDGVRTARLTVGADGLRSIIAQRLDAHPRHGSLRKLSLTFHARVDRVGSVGEMHVGDGVCVGIAPVADGMRCNLTVVADSVRYGRAVAEDPRAFVLAVLDNLPRTRGRVAVAELDAAVPLASGPFDRPVRQIAFDGAVLTGDAAGYYDPFTGQGVYQALASAFVLAPCIDDALRRGDTRASAFAPYARDRASLVRGARVVQRGIEAILSRPTLADHAIERVRRAPPFARAILAVTGDVAPARTLLSPRTLSSLLFRSIPENAA